MSIINEHYLREKAKYHPTKEVASCGHSWKGNSIFKAVPGRGGELRTIIFCGITM